MREVRGIGELIVGVGLVGFSVERDRQGDRVRGIER
jgi:hypothetical protein